MDFTLLNQPAHISAGFFSSRLALIDYSARSSGCLVFGQLRTRKALANHVVVGGWWWFHPTPVFHHEFSPATSQAPLGERLENIFVKPAAHAGMTGCFEGEAG